MNSLTALLTGSFASLSLPALTRRTSPSRARAECGTSSVELALLVPVLFLFILGTVDAGQAVVLYSGAGQAARDGARAAKIVKQPGLALSSSQTTAIQSTARDAAGLIGVKLAVAVATGSDTNGEYVKVTVTAAHQPVTGQFLKITSIPIGASSKLYVA